MSLGPLEAQARQKARELVLNLAGRLGASLAADSEEREKAQEAMTQALVSIYLDGWPALTDDRFGIGQLCGLTQHPAW